MATDMDIEMDLDVGLTEADFQIPEVDILPDVQTTLDQQSAKPILNSPNDTSDPSALEPAPNKVHIQHFSKYSPENVEWIDDTSANLIYENAIIAEDALKAFSTVEIADVSQIPLLQTIFAKSSTANPHANLEVRRAVLGDRKQAGARERSRFYLFNPEYDRAERRRKMGSGPRKYRDRGDGGYRSQRYDDWEQQSRVKGDEESGFDASLYDDDEVALAKRAVRRKNDSSSESDSRGQRARGRRFANKELFPEREGERGSGRLRDRSASPIREDGDDRDIQRARAEERRRDNAASANRLKAQMIKAKLRGSGSPKELFPQKTSPSHRRSGAFDAADETADLFANKMPVPFTDGSRDDCSPHSLSLAPGLTATTKNWDNDTGFSIRGAAKASPINGFSIKGAASGGVKELFPAHFGDNAGKELFSGKLEGRGRKRQKAEDLFY
ncbi:hypothetical protein G7Y89_g2760 [Cudoniella acicularis]|uniref:Uncharacterized protein n=1 Tax=Cudoniella acicularis TaxID=354080 RepID=A0A8H4RTW3_9HELO|nr:hypothetical protein G7Y89_g2760 [Cudoniella acicularis]